MKNSKIEKRLEINGTNYITNTLPNMKLIKMQNDGYDDQKGYKEYYHEINNGSEEGRGELSPILCGLESLKTVSFKLEKNRFG